MELIKPLGLGENVLAANCGACHGSHLASPAGGVGPIDNLELLGTQGQVDFCDPEPSAIVKSIRSGTMPPPDSGYPPVSPLDLDIILCTLRLECELHQADAGDNAGALDAPVSGANASDAAVPRATAPDGDIRDAG